MHNIKRTSVEENHDPQASDGFFRPDGNTRHIFERRNTSLCYTQPYYSVDLTGPQHVPNEPMRLTPSLREIRGDEVLRFGARRVREVRRLPAEFTSKIRAANDRDKAAEAEKNKSLPRLRWWHTRQSVESRDLLKTMKFTNATLDPQALLNANDVVILNLTGCALGDEPMVWVSTFLQQNSTLRRLNLQGNKLTEEGVRLLRPGLRQSRSLIDVNLSLNPIGDGGLNELVSAFSENIRHTKISRVNVSTCDLSASSGYHLARLIRDFATVEEILAWRNRIGYVRGGGEDLTGVALVFEELAVSKTLKHVDLSANCISEEVCLKHATLLEQIARERRLLEIEKVNRAAKIEQMTRTIDDMKTQELWEDERVILAGLERELQQEKLLYQQQLEEDARERRKASDFEWVERVRRLTGREVLETKSRVTVILDYNHSVTPMTLARLSQFYRLGRGDGVRDWLGAERRYDRIIEPRRRPGEEYEFQEPEQSLQMEHNVFAYEPEMHARELEAKLRREREMEEIRQQGGLNGKLASDILEERLRGRSSQRSRTPRSHGHDSSDPTATDSLANTQRTTLTVPGTAHHQGGGRSPRRRDVTLIEENTHAAPPVEDPRRTPLASPRGGTAHHLRRASPKGGVSPRERRPATAAADDAAPPEVSDGAVDSVASTSLSERSDAELFSDAASSVRTRPDGSRQRRNVRRVAARTHRVDESKISMSSTTNRGIPEFSSTQRTANDVDADDDRDALDAFGDDVFDDTAGGSSDVSALLSRLTQLNEVRPVEDVQRRLEARMEEMRERIAAKTVLAKAENVSPVAPNAVPDNEDQERFGPPSETTGPAIEIRPHHETGEVTVFVKNTGDEEATATSVPAAAAADPAVVAKALLFDGMSTVQSIWANIVTFSQIGSPTDDDLELLEGEKEKCGRFKASMAAELMSLGIRISVTGTERIDAVAGFMEALVKETDRAPGTTALVRALLEVVDVEWGPVIIDRLSLAAMAACDGSVSLLAAFLSVPGLRLDVVELVCSCCFNQAVRIPLMGLVLRHAETLRLAEVADDLQATWQEFFEDIASNKRAIPREDRTGRLELLEAMLRAQYIPIDAEAEGTDGQSCFSRACLEGDLDVVQLLVAHNKVLHINAIRSDGMSALHSAVLSNNPAIVQYLLDAPTLAAHIDPNVEGPEGSPLDFALLLQRAPRIAAILKEHGGRPTPKSAAPKPKPKGRPGPKAAGAKPASRTARRR